jgi:hypothetical protein
MQIKSAFVGALIIAACSPVMTGQGVVVVPNNVGASYPIINQNFTWLNANKMTSPAPAGQVIYTAPGAGAVPSTVQTSIAALGPTVIGYGACGDGVCDDTAAINKGIAYVCAHAPSTLIFPSNNTFLISGPLTPCSGLTLYGYGATIKLALAAGAFDAFQFIALTQHVQILGFTIDMQNIAGCWAIQMTGTAGVSGSKYRFADLLVNYAGGSDGSGGVLDIESTAETLTFADNITNGHGIPILVNSAADTLIVAENHLTSDISRCIDVPNDTGAATSKFLHNNLTCTGGAFRNQATNASLQVVDNEYEATATITNASSAAFEFLAGDLDVHGNIAGIHNYATYNYYVGSGVASSNFYANRGSTTGSIAGRYIWHNTPGYDVRYRDNISYNVNGANLYDHPINSTYNNVDDPAAPLVDVRPEYSYQRQYNAAGPYRPQTFGNTDYLTQFLSIARGPYGQMLQSRTMIGAPVIFDGVNLYLTTSGAGSTATVSGYTVNALDVGKAFYWAEITGANARYVGGTIRSVDTGANTWTFATPISTGAITGGAGTLGGYYRQNPLEVEGLEVYSTQPKVDPFIGIHANATQGGNLFQAWNYAGNLAWYLSASAASMVFENSSSSSVTWLSSSGPSTICGAQTAFGYCGTFTNYLFEIYANSLPHTLFQTNGNLQLDTPGAAFVVTDAGRVVRVGVSEVCTVAPTGMTIVGGIITAITGGTCTP